MRSSDPRFMTTHWSVVLTAGDHEDHQQQEALQTLCQTYWFPLYAFARQQGRGTQDAEDLTQGFLTKLVEQNLVLKADRERGRFRSFLLVSFKHFLADQRDRASAKKRGGDAQVFSLDFGSAKTRYLREPGHDTTAEDVYERQWALMLLERVYARLQDQYEAEGKQDLFAHLKLCLMQASSAVPYTELAKTLSQSEGALRVAVHRLRKRYRDLLRNEIAQTVVDSVEVEDEIQHLFRILSR